MDANKSFLWYVATTVIIIATIVSFLFFIGGLGVVFPENGAKGDFHLGSTVSYFGLIGFFFFGGKTMKRLYPEEHKQNMAEIKKLKDYFISDIKELRKKIIKLTKKIL